MGLLGLAPSASISLAAAAPPELRWIAYVRGEAAPNGEFVYRGALEALRSDGREQRTLIDRGVLAVDVGPRGRVYAAQEPAGEPNPVTSSLLASSVGGGVPQALYEEESGTYYSGVAASSVGGLALLRHVTKTLEVAPFLSGGVDVLRSTTVPILVPPEKPPGTEALVPSAETDSYQLLFTNDPAGELSHAEQINLVVTGTAGTPEGTPDPGSQAVEVRGSDGRFFCGASTCFLTWQELDVTYTVGEFGANEDAVAFAESLLPIEAVAGSRWQEGKADLTRTPELVVRDPDGNERLLESVVGYCECSFRPLDWSLKDDRLLVLASAEGYTTLQEYRADDSEEPEIIAEGAADPEGRDVILDAAYGPDGIVVLFGGDGGPPGTLQELGGDVLATDVRAFDIESSTLAYASANGDVVVKDLSTGKERTVGEGAIDISVGPDVIVAGSVGRVRRPEVDEGFPVVLVAVIGGAALALLAGATLLSVSRRRGR